MHRPFDVNAILPATVRPYAMLATPERLTIDGEQRAILVNDSRLQHFLSFVRDPRKMSAFAMLLRAQRIILTHGPRVFRPTLQQCFAMEQVEVAVPLRDYRQPYEVTLVDLPIEYAELRGVKSPYLLHHADDALFGFVNLAPAGDIHFYLRKPDRVLEAMLSHATGVLPESRLREVKLVERVAVNCCLLLTQYEHRLADLGSRSVHRENQQRRRRRGDRTPLRLPQEIRLVQHIDFHAEEQSRAGVAEGQTGVSVQPHWRKGHWRRQAFGTGWSHHRLVFIRPVLVNAHLDAAAPADRQAIYYGRDERTRDTAT